MKFDYGKLLEALEQTTTEGASDTQALQRSLQRNIGDEERLGKWEPLPPPEPVQTVFHEQNPDELIETELGAVFSISFALNDDHPEHWFLMPGNEGDVTLINTTERNKHMIHIFRADMIGDFVITFSHMGRVDAKKDFYVSVRGISNRALPNKDDVFGKLLNKYSKNDE